MIPADVVAFIASLVAVDPAISSNEPTESRTNQGLVVLNAIESLPTKPWFLLAVVLIVLGYSVSCWWRRRNVLGCLEFGYNNSRLVGQLRLRALFVRIRAEMLLGGVVASLLGGLYSSIFLSQYVVDKDRLASEAALYDKYRPRIDALAEGKYWLRTETFASDTSGQPSLRVGEEGLVLRFVDRERPNSFVSSDYGATWRRVEIDGQRRLPWGKLVAFELDEQGQLVNVRELDSLETRHLMITAAEFHGEHGLVGTIRTTYVTNDEGKRWDQRTRETVVGAALDKRGPRVLVNSRGSVSIRSDGGWTPVLKTQRPPLDVSFDAKGQHGLIATSLTTHVTSDGGETWVQRVPRDFGLDGGEWVVGAALDKYGPLVVVGNDQSVRIRTSTGWISADLELRGGLLDVYFHADGQQGLIATTIETYVTGDGGETWQQNRLGLNPNESLAGAVLSDSGALLVVGDEGTVHVPASGNSIQTVPPDYVASNKKGGLVLLNSLQYVDDGQPVTKWARTSKNDVWTKSDEGVWQQLRTKFLRNESVAATTSSAGGEPIVVGNRGSVYMEGHTTSFRGDFPGDEEGKYGDFAVTFLDENLVMAVSYRDEVAVYSKTRHRLDNIEDLQALIQKLPDESNFRKDVASSQLDEGLPKELSYLEKFGIDQTFWMRLVTMAATIYFVQLLVRLYQYAVRLATFLDARADAILLHASLGDTNTKSSFNELVFAMGHESVDFKPPQFPYTEGKRGTNESR